MFKRDPAYLLRHQRRYNSLSGEDGLLLYILRQLPERDHWCAEFGAWDGVYLSNTHYLISHAGYNAVLIEGDKNKFETLTGNMSRWTKTICINKFVRIDGRNSLDCILGETPITKNFDLLSIDIDGDDYHVWKSLHSYRPKVVIIEIGLYYKPGVHRINEIGSDIVFGVTGTSISSMTELAEQKDYKLICCIGCNAVYVKSEYYSIFHTRNINPAEVFCYDQLPSDRLVWNEKIRKLKLKLIAMRPISEIMKSLVKRFSKIKDI